MNIGDYVYVYLFDLDKSLKNMSKLREDRFGKIINIHEIKDLNRNEIVKVYDIELLNRKVITYHSNNLSTSIVSISDLISIIDSADIDQNKKRLLLDQLNDIL